MQLGTENRNQIILLLVLVVIAAIAVPRFFSTSTGAAKPQPGSAAASGTSAKKLQTPAPPVGKRRPPHKPLLPPTLDPALRFDLLKLSENQEYQGGKRNIFEARAIEIPQPNGNGTRPGPSIPPPPQQPPGPPPIPLKFYGFATQPGQPKRVFLSSTTGDDVFVGTEGQVINRRYRIVKVNNSNVEIEDILNNNKQTIPLSPPS